MSRARKGNNKPERRTKPRAAGESYRWVDTEQGLDEVVEAICEAPRFALDTEFHRERTYYPKVALVQLSAVIGE